MSDEKRTSDVVCVYCGVGSAYTTGDGVALCGRLACTNKYRDAAAASESVKHVPQGAIRKMLDFAYQPDEESPRSNEAPATPSGLGNAIRALLQAVANGTMPVDTAWISVMREIDPATL